MIVASTEKYQYNIKSSNQMLKYMEFPNERVYPAYQY